MRQPADDQERLNLIIAALERINGLSGSHMVIVEGMKDIVALKNLGVDAQFYCVQSGGGPVRAAEAVWKAGKSAIIMTDWDRRGNDLADDLFTNLSALGVEFDRRIRSEISFLCKPYCKDVESLDSVVLHLQNKVLESQ